MSAVHVADALAHEFAPGPDGPLQLAPPPLDLEYLAGLGADRQVDRWRAIAREEALRFEPL
jgi:hypothetical protein